MTTRMIVDGVLALEQKNAEMREQLAWVMSRCNAARASGFSGTPAAAVEAACTELERLRRRDA